jgi:D-alanyl-D-alanine carboxypeptidase (penicillin-binding protein 5/6)
MGDRGAGRGGALWALTAVTALALHAAVAFAGESEPPRLTARAGLVMDAQTGEILWERNGDLPLPPASTTKILTSVLALESGRLDESLTVSANAQAQAPTKLDLRAGQQVRLMDLVYALMLKSANDAAVVVAEGLGGSVEGFAAKMNRRAREMGATRSDFHNPHGLPNPDHVSTAHDLAVILRHALGVPGFRGVASTQQTDIPVVGTSKSVRTIEVRSHNRLLGTYVVPVVGKTGYTRAAGRCFAGAAALDGREVIIVVLGSSNLWGDARKLIAYGLGSLAPDAASRLQFAAADPPPSRGSAARSKKAAPAKKQPAIAKSKRKPANPTATAKRSSAAAMRKTAPAAIQAAPTDTGESRSAKRRGCTGSGC